MSYVNWVLYCVAQLWGAEKTELCRTGLESSELGRLRLRNIDAIYPTPKKFSTWECHCAQVFNL